MKRTCGNKQNVVCPHHAVARIDGCPFHDRQNIPLHTLARNIRPVSALASCNLVDFIQEDNSICLHALHSCARHLIHVDQASFFFLNQIIEGFGDFHLPFLGGSAKDIRQNILQIDVHLLRALSGDDSELGRIAFARLQFHHPFIQLAFPELLPQLLPRACVALRTGQRQLSFAVGLLHLRRRRKQQIQQALLGILLCLVFHLFQSLFAHHVDGNLHQVADHRLHVAPHIAHFGELAGFHLQKRRVRQLGQPAGNFRLAHAGRSNHDDVLRHDVIGQIGRQLLPARPIPQRHSHGALGCPLTHHMLVQLGHNLPWRQLFQHNLLIVCHCRQRNRHKFPITGPVFRRLGPQLLNRNLVVGVNADLAGNPK